MTHEQREAKSEEFRARLTKAGLDHLGVVIGPCKDGIIIHLLDEGQPLYKDGLDLVIPAGVPTADRIIEILPEFTAVNAWLLYHEC